MVWVAGAEPTTLGFRSRCSTGLSYTQISRLPSIARNFYQVSDLGVDVDIKIMLYAGQARSINMPDEEFKIEKGVPIPQPSMKRWPFDKMEIGDSFFSADKKVQSAAHSWAGINQAKMTVRKVEGGFRVWRIK
jgi:hypothetical protein